MIGSYRQGCASGRRGSDVIRFSCPNCGRDYALADALAHLPLLCKGCGQRLNVPDPQPEPEPPPPPPVKRPPKPTAAPKPPPPPVAAAPPEPKRANGTAHRPPPAPDPDDSSDVELILRPPPPPPDEDDAAAVPVRRPPPARSAPPPAPPEPTERPRRGLGLVVDLAVVLILLAGGVFAGEMLVKKSSAQVIRESSAAPKFPPMDLLLWLAGPVLMGLIYMWLGTRGWTVGGWLRRRAA